MNKRWMGDDPIENVEAAEELEAKATSRVVPLDKIVRAFLRIREERAKIKDDYESQDRVLQEAQTTLQAHLLDQMNTTGIDNFSTKYGTVYKSETIMPTASDWTTVYKWIAEHDAFEMLERRIKKTLVTAYMEQNDGDAPPGVAVLRKFDVNVRRKN